MGLLAALGVRLAWAVIYPAKPVSDFHWYYEVGREIADGRGIAYLGHATAIRPPGYPLLVAFANVLSGNRLLADRLLTVALGVGTVWLAYLIARIAFSSELAGRVTLVLVALFPNQIAYSNLIASEMPFTFFTLLGAWVLMRKRPGFAAYVGAGAAFGAALLIRPQGVIAPVVVLVATTWRLGWKTLLRGTVLVSLVMGLLLAPWIIRNDAVFGKPMYSTIDGEGLLEGTFRGSELQGKLIKTSLKLVPETGNAVVDDGNRRRYAIRYIQAHPGRYVGEFPKKIATMYGGDSDAFRWTIEGLHGKHEGSLLTWVTIGDTFYDVVLAMSLLGLCLLVIRHRGRRDHWLLPAMVVVMTSLSYLPFLALQRYHVPLIPWMTMYAGALSAFVIRSKHTPPTDFDGNNERSDPVQAAS